MKWLDRLLGRKPDNEGNVSTTVVTSHEASDTWIPIETYIPASSDEIHIVSLISSAIAANDQSESEFIIKKVWKVNPEVKHVSLIASAIAAGSQDESQFVVKNIYKKRKEG